MSIQACFEQTSVIPVLAFESIEEAVTISRVLYGQGMKVLEITLRHPSALDAIRAVIADLPDDAIVGAGTVMGPELAELVVEAGAAFGVSPGLTRDLAIKVMELELPFLPGVATISEAMMAVSLGFTHLKFFPATASGGVDFLKAASAVLPEVQFCPTGGITPSNAAEFLALKNVPVVGGSWLTPRDAMGKMDPDAAATLSRVAATFSV